jgi:ribosomal-protein-alanine N-acetyltransferase
MTSVVAITKENLQPFLQEILEIEQLSFQSPWSVRALRSEIENPISHLWAVIMGKVTTGYICFWMVDREIQLMSMAVHPHERGKGLAHYLLKEMIGAGITKGVRQIWLEVRPSNVIAKGLYERLGFKETYRRAGYYPDTHEDAIVMSLNLSEVDPHTSISN